MDQQISRVRSNHARILALPAEAQARVFGSGKHKFLLNPVAMPVQVDELERTYRFSIPEGYRRFILEVGDGGAGPFYGLKQRFVTFGSSLRKMEAATYSLPSVYVSEQGVLEDEGGDDIYVRGNMMLFEVGCGTEGVLVLNGPMRGKVCITDYGYELHKFWSPPDFLDMYESWQAAVLSETVGGLFGF
jgi:hypothetical protein